MTGTFQQFVSRVETLKPDTEMLEWNGLENGIINLNPIFVTHR